ncbi:MAG: multicopper oxidase domain-containing protein [Nitrospirae bacterium]|nr:multicopper oxidase domain-containing protein [Nitrospirota bacterium]
MRNRLKNIFLALLGILSIFIVYNIPVAQAIVQCPANDPLAVCIRLGATDGYTKGADGEDLYIFGFVDLTGVPENEIVNYKGQAHLPGPMIEVWEGQHLYITETNLGFSNRIDLFDPHTLHFHGFPHAMAIFDGVPDNSIAVNDGQDFTYFYQLNDPGTYPYHCHQEPVEHIQMGMVALINVHPLQDVSLYPDQTTALAALKAKAGIGDFKFASNGYAYNDGGTTPGTSTTYFDRAFNFLIDDIDARKHHNDETIQESKNEWHDYHPNQYILNGRVYPDTLLAPNDSTMTSGHDYIGSTSALVTANQGEKVLLRMVNLGYKTHTLTIPGITMRVIGEDAKILRGPTGLDLSYSRTGIELAGGKTADILLDTAGVAKGTYFMYARELNQEGYLSLTDILTNAPQSENNGGMMTQIIIN